MVGGSSYVLVEGEAQTGTSLTLLEIAQGYKGLEGSAAFEVTNNGADFTDFQLYLKDHPDGEWYLFASGTDWTTLSSEALRFSSPIGGINVLPSGSTGHIRVAVGPTYGMKLVATAATETVAQARGLVAWR